MRQLLGLRHCCGCLTMVTTEEIMPGFHTVVTGVVTPSCLLHKATRQVKKKCIDLINEKFTFLKLVIRTKI